MAQVLDFWKTASAGDPYQYAVGVVSYGLEKLIQQAASTNQSSTLRQLLEDALEFGHEKGIKVMANRLGAYYLTKNRLRYAFDLYFHLDSLPALDNTSTMAQIVYDKNKTRSILLTAAKSKYHVDMYRLYQRFTTHYPSSLELRAYTHILQSLIRTKQYDHALVVYQDVLSQATRLLVSDGQAEHTKRLFHLVYSLCAQTGDADLFQSVVTLQRQVGFPNLPHHSLTSLMATYVKKGELTSAKAVFDHLAHQQQQQPQALTPSSITADQDHDHDGGDRPEEVEQSDVVDVVDFNLLMRIVGQEQVEFRKQGGEEPVANRILDILRHMALVGVQSNATTLRTLLDVYQEDGEMEDEMFTTLMNDPQATHHDHIWLNNLKLTRILLYGNDNNNGDLGDNAMEAAKVFLSNKRLHLFPTASPDEPILADGMTYKLLLDQLTKNHHTYMAQHIFDHMRSRGWRPPIAVYEQLVAAWARKGRLVKAKAAMAVACQDLGWTIAPTKWYTLVLDLLVQNKSNRVNAWVLEIKKTETLLLDPVLAKRFVTYGLDPFSISSSSSTCASKTPRQQHRKQSQQ
ncbi:hypothetical protein BC941DRAFT_450328 [Chlamydoabsidia padenii]|nr:hypothetical protein BC941DRAFT_450328 [Chlamydoabsidia padenii]